MPKTGSSNASTSNAAASKWARKAQVNEGMFSLRSLTTFCDSKARRISISYNPMHHAPSDWLAFQDWARRRREAKRFIARDGAGIGVRETLDIAKVFADSTHRK